MMAYTRRLCPKGYLQFRLKVYERVGISLVEVYLTIIQKPMRPKTEWAIDLEAMRARGIIGLVKSN